MARTADAEARDRILRVAGRLFYEHGTQAVGMARIIDEAGCGKNLLYRHFPSKADLVAAYLRGFGEVRDRATSEALAGLDGDPAAALAALTREIADRVAAPTFRGCAFRNYLREAGGRDDEPSRIATAWLARGRAQVDDLVAELGTGDPGLLSERIWLLLDGLYMSAVYPERARAAAVAVGLVEELVGEAA